MRMRAVLLPLRIPQPWGAATGVITALVFAGIGLYVLLRPQRFAERRFRLRKTIGIFPIAPLSVFLFSVRISGVLILLMSVGFLVMLILSVFG